MTTSPTYLTLVIIVDRVQPDKPSATPQSTMTLYYNVHNASNVSTNTKPGGGEASTATPLDGQRIYWRESPAHIPSDAQRSYPQRIMARDESPDTTFGGAVTGDRNFGGGGAYPSSSTPHPASQLPNVPFARKDSPTLDHRALDEAAAQAPIEPRSPIDLRCLRRERVTGFATEAPRGIIRSKKLDRRTVVDARCSAAFDVSGEN